MKPDLSHLPILNGQPPKPVVAVAPPKPVQVGPCWVFDETDDAAHRAVQKIAKAGAGPGQIIKLQPDELEAVKAGRIHRFV